MPACNIVFLLAAKEKVYASVGSPTASNPAQMGDMRGDLHIEPEPAGPYLRLLNRYAFKITRAVAKVAIIYSHSRPNMDESLRIHIPRWETLVFDTIYNFRESKTSKTAMWDQPCKVTTVV
jgi:hypothetical protein